GLPQLTQVVDTSPHPDPLPASGAREHYPPLAEKGVRKSTSAARETPLPPSVPPPPLRGSVAAPAADTSRRRTAWRNAARSGCPTAAHRRPAIDGDRRIRAASRSPSGNQSAPLLPYPACGRSCTPSGRYKVPSSLTSDACAQWDA